MMGGIVVNCTGDRSVVSVLTESGFNLLIIFQDEANFGGTTPGHALDVEEESDKTDHGSETEENNGADVANGGDVVDVVNDADVAKEEDAANNKSQAPMDDGISDLIAKTHLDGSEAVDTTGFGYSQLL